MGAHGAPDRLATPATAARRLVLIYVVFATFWIVVSGTLLVALLRDPEHLAFAETVKGLSFVAVTGLLLYVLVSRQYRAMHDALRHELAAQDAGRRLQEQIVREHEQRQALASHYGSLIEQARDIVLLIDPEGRIVEANHAAEQTYGRSREDLRGMTVLELRAPDAMDDIEGQWQASASAAGVLFETTQCHRNGRAFPVEVSSRMVEIEGKPYRQSFIRDITERRQAEQHLKQRNAELERFNRASVDRELDMIALKRRVNALSAELGRAPPFDLGAVDAAQADAGQ